MSLSFSFDHFLNSRAEILQIFRLVFGKCMTPKSHSEINLPLLIFHPFTTDNGLQSWLIWKLVSHNFYRTGFPTDCIKVRWCEKKDVFSFTYACMNSSHVFVNYVVEVTYVLQKETTFHIDLVTKCFQKWSKYL